MCIILIYYINIFITYYGNYNSCCVMSLLEAAQRRNCFVYLECYTRYKSHRTKADMYVNTYRLVGPSPFNRRLHSLFFLPENIEPIVHFVIPAPNFAYVVICKYIFGTEVPSKIHTLVDVATLFQNDHKRLVKTF